MQVPVQISPVPVRRSSWSWHCLGGWSSTVMHGWRMNCGAWGREVDAPKPMRWQCCACCGLLCPPWPQSWRAPVFTCLTGFRWARYTLLIALCRYEAKSIFFNPLTLKQFFKIIAYRKGILRKLWGSRRLTRREFYLFYFLLFLDSRKSILNIFPS